VSRETNGLCNFEVPSAWAAKISARFVTDLEPGIVTDAETGFKPRNGAGQFVDEFICMILSVYYLYMCGRFAQSKSIADLVEEFGITGNPAFSPLPANWNIAPTNPIYIVRNNSQNVRELSIASWGIIAPWIKDEPEAKASQSRAINARSESIFEKPTFRESFKSRRCLIPADGYYEWATELGRYKTKQPFYISNPNLKSLSIAGIWSQWKSPNGELINSAAVITRDSVNELATIHNRMPVMMSRDRWDLWLDNSEHTTEELLALMENAKPDDGLHPWPVSDEVNKVANNGPQLVNQIQLSEPETLF
jgi:putative SOS response-associated peptidase YedK